MNLTDIRYAIVDQLSPFTLILGCISVAIILLLLRRWLRAEQSLKESEVEIETIVGEEDRMFEFLHMLGVALEQDHTETKLHREIVDGLVTVVDGLGGAIYLLSKDKRYLEPTYLSAKCPPLIGLPVEVLEKAKQNPQAIRSALRLSKTPVDEGVLGSIFSDGIAQLIPDMKNHEAFRDAFVKYENNISAMISPLTYAGQDIGILAITRTRNSQVFSNNEFKLFQAASEQSAFALGNAKIHREANEKKSIENELRIAREVQSILLPQTDPEINGYRILGTNKPARIISGDYFDYIPLADGRTAVVIADVTGKGVAAGLLMAMCRSALRAEVMREPDPLVALSHVNKQIYADIREDMFISLALYIINDKNGEVELICAGHDKAPLFRNNGEIEWIKPPGLALGLDDGDVFSRVTKLHTFTLEKGDCLLLYTDGVTEAMNSDLDEYGADKMVDAVKPVAKNGADHALAALHKDLGKFVGNYHQMDDITTIAIEKR